MDYLIERFPIELDVDPSARKNMDQKDCLVDSERNALDILYQNELVGESICQVICEYQYRVHHFLEHEKSE